jgi:hypothetical protein
MAETRKLAAILPADVAGYSKLAGADEERTLLGRSSGLRTCQRARLVIREVRLRSSVGGAPGDQQKAATSAQRHGRGRQTAA